MTGFTVFTYFPSHTTMIVHKHKIQFQPAPCKIVIINQLGPKDRKPTIVFAHVCLSILPSVHPSEINILPTTAAIVYVAAQLSMYTP